MSTSAINTISCQCKILAPEKGIIYLERTPRDFDIWSSLNEIRLNTASVTDLQPEA